MPHVSRKRLKKKAFKRINDNFFDAFGNLVPPKEMKMFLNEILTKTEKTMLSKRLALIFMLKRGYSFTAIRNILKVSPSTVVRIWKDFKLEKFSYVASKVKIKPIAYKQKNNFWEELDSILTLGLPPRGKGRWKFVDRALNRL